MKNTVRYWREKRNFSQGELASRVGVQPQTIWNIEHAKNAPRASTLRKLSEVLAVPAEELFSEDDEKPAA